MKQTGVLLKLFDFFVFSSLFIATCAVLMVCQTTILFSIPLPFSLFGFVFSGSVCSYNFHWYLTPPSLGNYSEKLGWNVSNRKIHLVFFIIGLLGSAVFTFLLLDHWFWLIITAFVTFLYSAPKIPHPLFFYLRKIAIGKTIFLAFAWAHVTALLPIVIVNDRLNEAQIWFVVNRFFLIYAICILFDYRDREEDKKDGIKTFILHLNEQGINIVFWGSMFACFATLILLSNFLPLTYVIALGIPGILLSFLYSHSKKNFSDYLYYFVLDGLMMLSAPLLVLAKFAR